MTRTVFSIRPGGGTDRRYRPFFTVNGVSIPVFVPVIISGGKVAFFNHPSFPYHPFPVTEITFIPAPVPVMIAVMTTAPIVIITTVPVSPVVIVIVVEAHVIVIVV